MVLPELLPAALPTDALFLGLLALVMAGVAMNWQRNWAIKALDLREPFLVSVGILVAALASNLSAILGGTEDAWLVLGALVVVFGLFARVSEKVDL